MSVGRQRLEREQAQVEPRLLPTADTLETSVQAESTTRHRIAWVARQGGAAQADSAISLVACADALLALVECG